MTKKKRKVCEVFFIDIAFLIEELLYVLFHPFLDCMDKESEEYCADANCQDKKMAKKCMNTCGMCENMGEGGDTKGRGKYYVRY